MIYFLDNTKASIRKLLQLLSESSKIAGEVNVQKSMLAMSTCNKKKAIY